MNRVAGWSMGVGGSMVALVTAIGGVSATLHTSDPCACISTNEIVAGELRVIEDFVQRYMTEHGDMPPSFKEVESMYRQKKEAGNFYPSGRIKNNIEPTTRNPTFNPGEGDQATFLYAVSKDGRSYALAGIGLREVRRWAFGVPLWRVKNDFPVLRPGAPLPQGSPQS